MTDWNKVADALCNPGAPDAGAFAEAITLCRRMATGDLVERSENVRWLDSNGEWVESPLRASPATDAADVTIEQVGDSTVLRSQTTDLRTLITPPVATQDEREHCEKVWMTWDYCAPETGLELLIRERAAVRAECQAENDRLRARVQELDERLGIADAELEQYK